MKMFFKILLLVFVLLIVVVILKYKTLHVIAGFKSKYLASTVFLADRDFTFTDTTDTNFFPVKLAKSTIDVNEKSVTTSILGLQRKAIYRDGVGAVLLVDEEDKNLKVLQPNRVKHNNNDSLFFPYGNKIAEDTIFSNINYNKLNSAIDSMFAPKQKTRAVLVIHKDKIVAERYANGFDEKSLFLGWSMTKSILGTLYGVLECEGKLKVTNNAPITEWQNDERKEITINNLLQMNSGLAWEENYSKLSDVTSMLYLDKDMTKSPAAKSLSGKPNESWQYSSGTSNILTGILRDQFDTHQEYLDFWYEALIDRIGMHSMQLETDLSGNYIASSYTWATARDWSKFGLLYLKNGNWNGDQIFSEDWVKYATEPTPTSNGEYGATLWLNQGKQMPNVPKNAYHFKGYQGQYIFMLPDQETVVVRLGLVKDIEAVDAFVGNVVKAIN